MSDLPEQDENNLPVADRVLLKFVDALALEESLRDVSARLKAVLISDKPITELALRQALFNESDT